MLLTLFRCVAFVFFMPQVNEKAESLSSLSSQAQQLHAEKLALQEKVSLFSESAPMLALFFA